MELIDEEREPLASMLERIAAGEDTNKSNDGRQAGRKSERHQEPSLLRQFMPAKWRNNASPTIAQLSE
jgi:hypothetical protein